MKLFDFRSLRRTLPTLLAGASMGALAMWLWGRRRSRAAVVGGPTARADAENTVDEAADEHAEAALGKAPKRKKLDDPHVPLDLGALRYTLADIPGSEQVHLRHLGGGIVEALGAAPDAATVHRVLTALRSADGVNVVVNRIWTPSSARERKPDLSHIPRSRRDTSVN
jgi:hypothetical protein